MPRLTRVDAPKPWAPLIAVLAAVRPRLAALGPVPPLAAFGVALVVIALQTGTPILSHDDIFRTAYAYEWTRHPYFFTERLVWLPFPLILTGVVIRLTGEAFWTALAINVAAGALAIRYVHRLAELLFGRLSAGVAASLFALTPWILFLALSRYSEPIMLASVAVGVFHWIRWRRDGHGADAMAASLAMTAAVLSRYEAWPLGAALSIHFALRARARRREGPPDDRVPAAPLLCGLAPLACIGVWVWKNVALYGLPVYGGAFGFLPHRTPAGAWAGLRLIVSYLAELNIAVAVLGIVGAFVYRRSAPLLLWLIGLAVLVPWVTLSYSSIAVALQVRLMVVPLMLLAPFAAAAITRVARRDSVATALATSVVVAQLAIAARAQYPSAPLPMTLLARQLAHANVLQQFETLYLQSPDPWAYPFEVNVGLDFRRPVRVLAPEDRLLAEGTDGELPPAILILNDGQKPNIGGGGEPFVVAQVGQMTAWGLCPRRADQQSAAAESTCTRPER